MTSFDFYDMTYHTTMSVFIAVLFTFVLWVAFGSILESLKNEAKDELMLNYTKDNSYKEMFDSMMEGIIVMKNDKFFMMNELFKALLSILSEIDVKS
jgi:hypothetical protein